MILKTRKCLFTTLPLTRRYDVQRERSGVLVVRLACEFPRVRFRNTRERESAGKVTRRPVRLDAQTAPAVLSQTIFVKTLITREPFKETFKVV